MHRSARFTLATLALVVIFGATACAKEKKSAPEPAAVDPNAPVAAGGGPTDEAATAVTPEPTGEDTAASGDPKLADPGTPSEPAEPKPAEPVADGTRGHEKPVDSRPSRPTRPITPPHHADGDPPDDEAPDGKEPAAGTPMYPDGAKPNIPRKPRKPAPGTDGAPAQGQRCAAGKCAAGLQCVEYYGIAGPRGPAMTSCEIPCPGGQGCPAGQACTTIADGPGQVCRPMP